MTTTAVTTAAGAILVIDLGKYKCVACIDRTATEPIFHTIDTSRADVARLIERTRPAAVVVEACSLAGWVHDLCDELGVVCRWPTPAPRPGSTNTPNAKPTATTPSA